MYSVWFQNRCDKSHHHGVLLRTMFGLKNEILPKHWNMVSLVLEENTLTNKHEG